MSPQPVEMCVRKVGVMAEFGKEGALREGSAQTILWGRCPTTGLEGWWSH